MIKVLVLSVKNFFSKGHERTVLAKKNIIASLLVKGGSILVGLALVPLTIHYVNATQYGIWLTLSSLIGWFSFFDVGLGNGFTIPLHSPGALPASCSLVVGPDGVDPLDVPVAHWCAVYAHEAARRLLMAQASLGRPRLSVRERQCLEWVARGKEDGAIAIILGIQISTAHNTVQRAMKKYRVATRVQAVVRAMAEGEISLEDVAS